MYVIACMCIIFIYTIKERGSASHVIIKIILGAYIVVFRAQKSDESRSQL